MPRKLADTSGADKHAARAAGYSVESVARAIDLLAAFERPPHQFGVSELARQLGLTKNLVFRVLRTLEAQGFVLRVDAPQGMQYAIGLRLYDLSRHAVDRRQVLSAAARPYLDDLTRITSETTYLVAIADGGLEAICLERVESELGLRNRVDVGMRLPLFAGGGAKALLAFQPEAIQEAVITDERVRMLAAGTRTAPDDLRQDLARIRRDGYWIALEEYADGADALGAVVFDASGAGIAGVGITGPVPRLRTRLVSPELREPLIGPLLDAARALSRQLGYLGAYPAPWPMSVVVDTAVPSGAAA